MKGRGTGGTLLRRAEAVVLGVGAVDGEGVLVEHCV
jgi:hypothetical protein